MVRSILSCRLANVMLCISFCLF